MVTGWRETARGWALCHVTAVVYVVLMLSTTTASDVTYADLKTESPRVILEERYPPYGKA